jgi:uncharacterized protein (TIGR02246 family)
MTNDDLERRVRELEDQEEIHALLLAYRRALDDRDFRGYAALFAEDGVFTGPGFGATGHEEILTMLESLVPEEIAATAGDDVHLICNVAIDVGDDDTARAQSTWVFIVRGDGDTPRLFKLGHYHDELRRERGRWRFAHRRSPMLIPVS